MSLTTVKIIGLILVSIAGAMLFALAVWLVFKLVWAVVRGFAWLFSRLWTFVAGMVADTFRLAASLVMAWIHLMTALFAVVFARWERAESFGESFKSELMRTGACIYRLSVGHLARLFGLSTVAQAYDEHMPRALERVTQPLSAGTRNDEFPGYRVVGSLVPGGSGGKLWLAEPSGDKLRAFATAGLPIPRQVVIKSFSIEDGSTLPQIVRESRALEAARRLGLVLDHAMTSRRFHYVMPYVPGDDLGVVGQRLHERAGGAGLGEPQLREVMSYASDLLETLDRFHKGGLWHKDIKPSNVIVSQNRAFLVDFGLVTPLTSAMTLTTHGTEYFRDPEMVRLALKGVKVHEVDGVKFDVYGVGAVLYALVENSFPAHGSLSRVTKRCPEALRWIIRRAMADMQNRYGSAREMLGDVRAVMAADDAMAVKPVALPSVAGTPALVEEIARESDAGWAWPFAVSAAPTVGYGETAPVAAAGPVTSVGKTGAQRKSSAGRWVAAAAGILVLSMAGMAALLFNGTGSRRAQRGPLAHSIPLPIPESELHGSAGDGDIGSTKPAVLQEPVDGGGAPVLVLDDLPAGSGSSYLEEICSSLEAANFRVLGQGRAGVDPQRDLDLPAEVRKTLGLATPAEPEAKATLAGLLTTPTATDLYGIVWIGSDGDPRHPLQLVAARSEEHERDLGIVLPSTEASDSN